MKTNKKTQKQETHNKKYDKVIILTLLLLLACLFIIFIPLVQALSQIQLISQTDPLEYSTTQTVTLNITTNTINATIMQALIEFEGQNHTLEKANEIYIYAWIPHQIGNYTYTLYATDSLNETQTRTNSFIVRDTTPPEITETAPSGTLNYNLVELKAITNENSTCKYDEADVSYDSMSFSLSGQGLVHTQLRSFGEGIYLAYVRCKDPYNNIGQSKTISFTIDTKPPIISGIIPTGTVNQQQITLKLNTDETATCKWGRANQAYDYLENYFQATFSTYHEQSITLTEGINTYYLSCQDQVGNKDPTIALNLELNLPPKATVGVEIKNNYKALASGTYKVNLLATEPLTQAPSLALRYSNRLVNIPLEGSTNYWSGYLIIPEDAGEAIGEFIFSGTDNKGTTGTEITSGKLIQIDTTAPSMPTGLKLTNENNKIKLTWQYEGEETDHFNIYKSTTGNTGKADLKAASNEPIYTDSNVTNKIGYFYRISAVDKAGNEGQLSEEEFIMTELQNATSSFKQEPALLDIINTKINELEKTVQDLEVKTTQLEETTDQDLLQLINSEDLVGKQKDVKSKIQTLIGELKTYRETPLTRDELNAKIAIINSKLDEYKRGLVEEVKIKNKVENEQIIDANLVQEVVKEYLKDKTLSAEQKEEYQLRIKALQEEIRVMQKIISYSIEYKFAESKIITIIKETILSLNDSADLIMQEIIHKNLIKVSEISFEKTPKEFNSLGVIWDLKELENAEVEYSINDEKDLNQLQTIRTVLLYDVDEFLKSLSENKGNASNKLTGSSIVEGKGEFFIKKEILIPVGMLIILGLLLYYFVFLRTDNYYQKERVFGTEQNNLQKAKETKSDMNSIVSLIQKAYLELERQDTNSASSTYSVVFSLYSHANLNLKERLKVNFEMNSLHERIVEAQKTKHLYI